MSGAHLDRVSELKSKYYSKMLSQREEIENILAGKRAKAYPERSLSAYDCVIKLVLMPLGTISAVDHVRLKVEWDDEYLIQYRETRLRRNWKKCSLSFSRFINIEGY